MSDKTLNSILFSAANEGWALGHFNISGLEQLRAIVNAARTLRAPIHIGTSEGERKAIGLKQAVYLVRSFRDEFGIPIYLNADHTKSVEEAKAAVDAGYDSIHIDLSARPFEENARGTKEIVEYAKARNKDISVEGELGFLRGESKIQKEKIEVRPEDLTKPEEAVEFVRLTGVDRLAPVVGNIHGISANEPDLDIERVRAIHAALPQTTLVLHGGSGIPEAQIKAAITAGIANIHINTELRLAYVTALREFLAKSPDETTPYKLLVEPIAAVEELIKKKLTLFGSVNRI
ncbi:MAG: class II fructose-bisphosphate aldolase [Candidatus Niyogibacteria bacterium]|nr:class II fructose-bisphosphate aldolase [Candidatus Niyogibacteria bacterium]